MSLRTGGRDHGSALREQMVKCTKKQIRRLKTARHWKGHPEQRQRIQMVLLRESGMTQPAIADAMGVSLSTVNRAHMAYDHGGLATIQPGTMHAGTRRITVVWVAITDV